MFSCVGLRKLFWFHLFTLLFLIKYSFIHILMFYVYHISPISFSYCVILSNCTKLNLFNFSQQSRFLLHMLKNCCFRSSFSRCCGLFIISKIKLFLVGYMTTQLFLLYMWMYQYCWDKYIVFNTSICDDIIEWYVNIVIWELFENIKHFVLCYN